VRFVSPTRDVEANAAAILLTVQGATECVVAGTTLDFGAFTGQGLDVTIQVPVTCSSASMPWTLAFDAGIGNTGGELF